MSTGSRTDYLRVLFCLGAIAVGGAIGIRGEDEKKEEKPRAEDEKKDEKKEEAAPKKVDLLKILKAKPAEAEKKDTEKKDTEKKDAAKADEAPKDGEAKPEAAKKASKKKKKDADKPAEGEAAKADGAVEVKIDDVAAPAAKAEGTPKAEKDAPPAAPKKPKEPEPPMFRLRDGTRLAGMPDLKSLNVQTVYGKLVVPIGEVVRARFATAEDVKIVNRVNESIQALGSEEFDKREEAMGALREIGLPALDALKKAVSSEDEEVKSRAEKLVSEIEEQAEDADDDEAHLNPIAGEEDEVVTLKFTVKGKIEEQSFSLTTRYGGLKLSRNDIVSVVFREAPSFRQSVTVPGSAWATTKWVDTKIAFSQGEHVRLTATGQINLENYGQTTGPEGTTSVSGNQVGAFPTGALLGRIGDKGQPFLVGPDYDGSASGSGNLFLGVSMQQGNASGQYTVEVEKDGDS